MQPQKPLSGFMCTTLTVIKILNVNDIIQCPRSLYHALQVSVTEATKFSESYTVTTKTLEGCSKFPDSYTISYGFTELSRRYNPLRQYGK